MRISDRSSDVCSSDPSADKPIANLHDRNLDLFDAIDITDLHFRRVGRLLCGLLLRVLLLFCRRRVPLRLLVVAAAKRADSQQHGSGTDRSEEHTSELQSLVRISYAVFCLKKKKITT